MDRQEIKQPPILYLQIWDNDALSSDDFLGAIEINLSNFPEPFIKSKECILFDDGDRSAATVLLKRFRSERRHLNLFRQKSVRGWFPCRGKLKKTVADSSNKAPVTGLTVTFSK